jgi:outer membrane receptor protein involved in Fe transport
VTFDFNDYYRYDPNWTITGPDLALWTPIRNIVPGQPIQYHPKWFDWANHAPGRKNKNRTRVIGGLIREQATLLNSRLLLFGGGRWDRVNYNLRDLAAARQSTFTVHQFNPNVGANYKVTPQLAAYANYSRSFFPNQQFITAASISPAYKSETAEGYDYGFKGSFLQDRLNFTVAGYYIIRENVVVNVINDLTGVTESRPEGDHLVRGAEFDFNWQVNNDVTFGGSYGHVYSKITDFGLRTRSVGRSPARITPNNFGVYLKYAPGSGSLKGLSANLGVTYLDETPTEAPDAGDTYTGAAFTRSNDQWAVKVPSATVWNLGVRYTLPRSGRLGHQFGVNVNNLFDLDYLTPGKGQGDRRAVYFTYALTSGGR